MNLKTLASLAILKVNSDGGLDYIENFVPFLIHLIKIKNYSEISAQELMQDFSDEYGLIIPYHGIISIINRAKKRGYVKRELGKYLPVEEKIIEDDFTDISVKQTKKIDSIIESFRVYALEVFEQKISTEEAEKAIFSFIEDHNVKILFASETKITIPEAESSQTCAYLFSKYIQHILERDLIKFEYLVDISLGQALVDVITYKEFDSYLCNLKGMHCCLDADIIFHLLGTSGPERKTAYQEFLNTLLASKVKLILFSHTYDEIMSILRNCLGWINNPLFDESKASKTMLYFTSNGCKKSDIELFISTVKSTLDKFNIEIKDKPPYFDGKDYQVDEKKLKQDISKAYGLLNVGFEDYEYEKEGTIRKDVDSISAIYRLRKGRAVKTLKDATYIFITTNWGLASVAHDFEKENFDAFNIPACLTDVFVGTILWVSNPQKYREVNKKRLIADSYASLRPNDKLLRRYLHEINLLREKKDISEEQYYMLRSTSVAMNLLGEKTFNDPNNFSDKTPGEMLLEMEKERKKDYLLEKQAHRETKDKLERMKRRLSKLDSRVSILAKKYSTIISKLLFIIVIPLIIFGFLYSSPLQNWIETFIPAKILSFVSLLVTVLFVLNIIRGLTLRKIELKTRDILENSIKKFLEWWLKI